MTRIVRSLHGVPIRLTDERWAHVGEQHEELANLREEVLATVATPERVVAGKEGELLAQRSLDQNRVIVVVYRELSPDDGFVITAFLTSKPASLDRRKQVWPPTK